MRLSRLSTLTATAVVTLSLMAAAPQPAVAMNKKEEQAVGTILGVLAAAALAGKIKKEREKHYLNRGDGYVEPAPGVICYDEDRACYRGGNYSPRWSHSVYGY